MAQSVQKVNELEEVNVTSSIGVEAWLINTLKDAQLQQSVKIDFVKAESKNLLHWFGIEKSQLLKHGLKVEDIHRVYKSLFVYSLGFHEMLQSILKNTLKAQNIQTQVWKVFMILLESCCKGNYKLTI